MLPVGAGGREIASRGGTHRSRPLGRRRDERPQQLHQDRRVAPLGPFGGHGNQQAPEILVPAAPRSAGAGATLVLPPPPPRPPIPEPPRGAVTATSVIPTRMHSTRRRATSSSAT